MNHSSQCFAACAALLSLSLPAWSQEWYVSGSGNDAGNGTSASTAFRSLSTAAGKVNAGDTVWVMNGTYATGPYGGYVLDLTRPGNANAWITWKAYPGNAPEITFNGWAGIKVEASYQVIDGLIVTGNNDQVTLAQAVADAGDSTTYGNPIYNGSGIDIDSRNVSSKYHHITVRNCIIRKCGGGGLGSAQADYLTFENNQVYENAWYSRYANSGISIYQNWNFDQATGYHMVIRRNKAWNNRSLVKWSLSSAYSDGNGIIIDDSQNTQNGSTLGAYTGRTLVSDNLSFNNGGSGIHSFSSDHVDIVNNTAYDNGQIVGYAEIFAGNSTDVRILDNIMYARNGGKVNDSYGNGSGVVYDYNLYFNGPSVISGAHDVTADPRFIAVSTDPALANFQLQAGSPAIDSGVIINGVTSTLDLQGAVRPQGGGLDKGAYEFAGSAPANLPPSVSLSAPTTGLVGSGVALSASASDSDGSVAKVDFLVDGTVVGTDASAPFTYVWTAAAGTHSLSARATDNLGASTTSASISIAITAASRTTYGSNGLPWAISGSATTRIEAENFDLGGQGVAYNDTDAANQGGQYRTSEGVDIEKCSDAGGGYNVGWTANGEWLEYTVNVATAGNYDLRLRLARQPSGTSTIAVSFGGVDKTGSLAVPSTGAWQTWTTLTKAGISLAAGQQIVRVSLGGNFNINWLELQPSAVPNLAKNPGFEADGGFSQTPQAWSTWAQNGSVDYPVDYVEGTGGGGGPHAGDWKLCHWRASPWGPVNTYQLISGLADGQYTLRAWVRCSTNVSAIMYVYRFKTPNTAITMAIPQSATYQQISIPVLVENSQCEIGFQSSSTTGNGYVFMDDVEFVATPVAGNG